VANLRNLPPRLTRMIGRSSLVASLSAQLPQRRFLTLVGPGGIGKTTVAIAIAGEVASSYGDGVVFVDLGRISDPRLVPSTLATALGLAIHSEEEIPGLITFLQGKQTLLVLDSCEHVIEVAAQIAEEIYKSAPSVHILTTSREPLRSAGERVHRLPPLETPPESERLTAAEALTFPGVELFVERAAACLDGFELSDLDAPIVADICRRLDGIALAIELAASRIDVFGLRELATRLDDRFRLLTSGRRTALPRHRTLAAALDWSYELLPETERMVLRRLAVFSGSFVLEGACTVIGGPDLAEPAVLTALANLVGKSLIVADLGGEIVRYYLLNTTRLYAFDKLKGAAELGEAVRRHAEYHSDLFGRARAEWETQPTAVWLAEYGNQLDDLRAALDWAFSPDGDAALGVALTVDAVPLWLQLSLMSECRQRAELAISRIGPATTANARLRMRLFTALSLSRMYTRDPLSEVRAGWASTLELAEGVGDTDYQLRAIWGLFAVAFNSGNFAEALQLAERFRGLATDTTGRLIGERLIGTALHFLGDQKRARQSIEHMLAGYSAPVHSSHIIRYQNDQVVAARRVLAPILWLQGYPDQAMRMVEDAVADALAIDHALTLCNTLAQAACPLAFLTGNLTLAHRFTTLLVEYATRHSLDVWHAYGRCFEGVLLIRRRDFDRGLPVLRSAASELRQSGFMQCYTSYLCALAEGLAEAGQAATGLDAIDEGLARTQITEERWCIAELLRIKGELILRQGEPGVATTVEAEEQFRRSLDWARRQETPSWELRGATSLARLLRGQDRVTEARSLLSAAYGRFSEGFETGDLRTAEQVLGTLT